MAWLTHELLVTSTPTYFNNLLAIHTLTRTLLPFYATMLVVPCISTEIAWHTFSIMAPSNSLPADFCGVAQW